MLFRSKEFDKNLVNKKQVVKIIRLANETSDYIKMISYNPSFYEYQYYYRNRAKMELLYDIDRMKINSHTMYRLLQRLDNVENSSIKNLLFYILFNYKNEILTNILNQYDKINTFLYEDKKGEICVYSINFSKKSSPQSDFLS